MLSHSEPSSLSPESGGIAETHYPASFAPLRPLRENLFIPPVYKGCQKKSLPPWTLKSRGPLAWIGNNQIMVKMRAS